MQSLHLLLQGFNSSSIALDVNLVCFDVDLHGIKLVIVLLDDSAVLPDAVFVFLDLLLQ